MTWKETKTQLAAMGRKPKLSDYANWLVLTKLLGIPCYPEDQDGQK